MANLERVAKIASCLFYFARAGYYYSKWPIFMSIPSFVGGALLPGRIQIALISIGATLLILGLILWLRQKAWQLRSPNPCLKIISLEMWYKEIDETTCESTRTMEVEATSPVDFYTSNFAWSGGGDVVVEALEGVRRAETLVDPNSTDDACKLIFPHTLGKGDTHKFSYKINLSNARKPLRHFLGHSISGPIGVLNLNVVPLPGLNTKTYSKVILPSRRSALAIKRVTEEMPPGQTHIPWPIPKPLPGCLYRLVWE